MINVDKVREGKQILSVCAIATINWLFWLFCIKQKIEHLSEENELIQSGKCICYNTACRNLPDTYICTEYCMPLGIVCIY